MTEADNHYHSNEDEHLRSLAPLFANDLALPVENILCNMFADIIVNLNKLDTNFVLLANGLAFDHVSIDVKDHKGRGWQHHPISTSSPSHRPHSMKCSSPPALMLTISKSSSLWLVGRKCKKPDDRVELGIEYLQASRQYLVLQLGHFRMLCQNGFDHYARSHVSAALLPESGRILTGRYASTLEYSLSER